MVTPYAQGSLLRQGQDAPFVSLDELTGRGGVLVLTPHPDDETLGCGAAIAAASQSGYKVVVVALTDGRLSHPGYPADKLVALRKSELEQAVARLTGGRAIVLTLDYPDQNAPALQQDIQTACARILPIIESHKLTALWTTWSGDPHPDHQSAAAIGKAILKARPDLRLWQFPVWGRFIDTPAEPHLSVLRFDSSPYQNLKRLALEAHQSQMTNLLAEDPDGFVMEADMQRHFVDTPELFLREVGNV